MYFKCIKKKKNVCMSCGYTDIVLWYVKGQPGYKYQQALAVVSKIYTPYDSVPALIPHLSAGHAPQDVLITGFGS